MNSSFSIGTAGELNFNSKVGHSVAENFSASGDAVSIAFASMTEFPKAATGSGFAMAGAAIADCLLQLQNHGMALGDAVQLHGDGLQDQTNAIVQADSGNSYEFGSQF